MLSPVPRNGRWLSFPVALLLALPLRAGPEPEWGQFLGPRRDGVSAEKMLNLDWEKHPPKTLWKQAVGSAFSSLAVAGDRLVTTAKRGDRDFLVCLGAADGKELWSVDAAPSYADKQRQGAGPRSTPTIAGDRVYCLLPRGDLLCVALADGKKHWKTNVFEATGAKERFGETYYWGLSGSPLVEGELIIVQPGGDKDNAVAAFRRDTGKLVWGAGNDPACYASPVAITAHGRRMLVVPTGKSLLGLDPEKGDVLWRYEFGNAIYITCATPVWSDGLLFVSAAYNTGCAAVEIVKDGDKFGAREKWKNKNLQNLMATSIVLDGHVYGCHGDLYAMILKCLDLKTGEVKWEERLPGRCSLVAAEGHLFCLGERGSLSLVEANPARFVKKGEIKDLLTYKAWAMPALANKRLYLRDEQHVICLDLGKP